MAKNSHRNKFLPSYAAQISAANVLIFFKLKNDFYQKADYNRA